MKKNLLNNSWWLVAMLVLSGCGGAGVTSGSLSGAASDPPPDPPAPALSTAENWQFSTTSTQGFPPITIAGGIDQSTPASGVVHIDGSPCFDHLSAVKLTGVLNDSNLSLSSSSIAGQVITYTGSIAKDPLSSTAKFTGTYSIQGGCADGDQGNITGGVEPTTMRGLWAGDLTSAAGNINRLTVTLQQGSATSDGTFGITGSAGFEVGTCFQRAEIVSGKFPSGSYMMGQTVSLEIQTDNGVIAFLGTADHGGLIEGNYTLAGGACDPKGTGYLSPWEY